jgi:carbon-monoxide dehydrogenase medium subunit
MKPAPFDYHAPDSLDEVLALLAEHGDESKVIAGGQSLVPMLAMRLARPTQLVDVTGVGALAGVSLAGDVLRIGATTTERELERSAEVSGVPALVEALPLIGHMAIRNRGTVGGSLAHADASGELPAVAVATGATMRVRGPDGDREVAADDFFLGHYTTALDAEDCLLGVDVPTTNGSSGSTGWAVQEVARRHGDFALVGVVTMVALDGSGAIAEARICQFGVSERPHRDAGVEASLVGATPTDETFAGAAADAVRDLEPADDVHGTAEFRRHLAEVTVRRALATATERARRGEGSRA